MRLECPAEAQMRPEYEVVAASFVQREEAGTQNEALFGHKSIAGAQVRDDPCNILGIGASLGGITVSAKDCTGAKVELRSPFAKEVVDLQGNGEPEGLVIIVDM